MVGNKNTANNKENNANIDAGNLREEFKEELPRGNINYGSDNYYTGGNFHDIRYQRLQGDNQFINRSNTREGNRNNLEFNRTDYQRSGSMGYQRNNYNQPYPNGEYQYYGGNMHYQIPPRYGLSNSNVNDRNYRYNNRDNYGNNYPGYKGRYGDPYGYNQGYRPFGNQYNESNRYDDEFEYENYGYIEDFGDEYYQYRGDGYFNYPLVNWPHCSWYLGGPRWGRNHNRWNPWAVPYGRPMARGGFWRNLFNLGAVPFCNPMVPVGPRIFW
jgi:hypothetical protein